MRKALFGLVLLILVFAAIPALAQVQAHFAAVNVDIWPEYDRPAVLVITYIDLPPQTTLPAHLTLRIPSQASVWAVAYVPPAGGPVNALYALHQLGNWSVLTITANSLKVQVEYYDLLMKKGTYRHIMYQWPGDAAVDAFTVNFLQPVGALDLVLVPPMATSSMTSQGLTNYQTDTFRLDEGQTFSLSADYQKQTEDLSVSGMPVEPAQSTTQNPSSSIWAGGLVYVTIGSVAGLLLIFVMIGLVRMRRDRRQSALLSHHSRDEQDGQASVGVLYCNQCGKRAQPEDIFCRSCGTHLRKEV